MLYRRMQKTGDELSVLGFGCMRLPQKKGRPGSGKIDEARATKQVRYAIDRGVNYVDTAVLYHMGTSEAFLGRALGDGYRQKVKLATKLYPVWVKTRNDMDTLLDRQRRELKTDQIDYYLLHGLNATSWKKMHDLGALDFLEKVKKEGRIAHTGFSFHGDRTTFTEIIDAYDWDLCQIQYNFLDEQNQAGTEGLKYAAARGLGVVIMEPLRGGNLTKELPAVKGIWNEADVKRTPAEWGLRWVWNHPEVTVALSGMNEETHIDENLRIANEAYPGSLTEMELQIVNRVAQTYRNLMRVECTGCRYCMPCASGVDIPACFEAYNNLKLFGDPMMAKMWYLMNTTGMLGTAASHASLCKECGKCVNRCPQQLPIPELLKNVASEMEGWWFKPAAWGFNRFLAWKGRGAVKKAARPERTDS